MRLGARGFDREALVIFFLKFESSSARLRRRFSVRIFPVGSVRIVATQRAQSRVERSALECLADVGGRGNRLRQPSLGAASGNGGNAPIVLKNSGVERHLAALSPSSLRDCPAPAGLFVLACRKAPRRRRDDRSGDFQRRGCPAAGYASTEYGSYDEIELAPYRRPA
jgi:hypothetical protein